LVHKSYSHPCHVKIVFNQWNAGGMNISDTLLVPKSVLSAVSVGRTVS